jgi:hypothetical protein
LKLIFSRAKKAHTAPRLTTIPRSASSAATPRKVKSGFSSIRASNHPRSPAKTSRRFPPIGFAAALPVWRWRCDHRTTLETLTPNSTATDRQLSPAATRAATRSRRSNE